MRARAVGVRRRRRRRVMADCSSSALDAMQLHLQFTRWLVKQAEAEDVAVAVG